MAQPADGSSSNTTNLTAGFQPLADTVVQWWVLAFLVSVGALFAVIAVTLAFKYRRNLPSSIGYLGGGVSVTAVLSAMGTQINGLPIQLSIAGAIAIAGTSFITTSLAASLALLVFIHWVIISPIRKRYSYLDGAKAWAIILSGRQSISEWLRHGHEAEAVDRAWDEFACVISEVRPSLEDDLADDAGGFLQLLREATNGDPEQPPVALQEIFALISEAFELTVCEITQRLTLTTLNFTLWRIDEDKKSLAFIQEFPARFAEPHTGRRRDNLPIWKGPFHVFSGSAASYAMLTEQYVVVHERDVHLNWERRQLGRMYKEIGCLPLPWDGSSPPWGVLCVENRQGLVPLKSNAVRAMMTQLGTAIVSVSPTSRLGNIDESRPVDRSKPKQSHAL